MDALERGLEADTPYPRRARAATSRNSRLGVRGGRTALAEYAWGGGGGRYQLTDVTPERGLPASVSRPMYALPTSFNTLATDRGGVADSAM